jgi:hypothetical protein
MNRRIYHDLSPAVIDSIADDDLEQVIVDHVAWKANADGVPDDTIVERLPRAISTVFTTRLVEDEIFNGGFNQLFFNSRMAIVERAAEAYRTLGALKHEGIIKTAIERAVREGPALNDAREARTIQAFSDLYKVDLFRDLDSAFNELGSEDISAIRIRYIRTHAGELSG